MEDAKRRFLERAALDQERSLAALPPDVRERFLTELKRHMEEKRAALEAAEEAEPS
jgi:nucleoid-associated protein YgaU